MKQLLFLLLTFSILTATRLMAQTPTYAEKLGFPKGKKVIILHVDDAGMCYDANQGTRKAMEQGIVSSTSVMMPCPWVPQYMEHLKQHPTIDAGVHLVMTSEWNNYRWFPLVGRDKAPGLYDEQGAFWHSVAQVVEHASADEVEAEIRAQIARFKNFGVQPTHLDSHMGTLFQPKFVERYVKVGIEEKIPVLFPGGHAALIGQVTNMPDAQHQWARQVGQQLWAAGLPVLDDLDGTSYDWKLPAGTPATDDNLRQFKTQKFIDLLKRSQPGLTYVIMHCTDPTEVFAQISDSGPGRKGDMLAMMDPALKAYIQKEGIIITTWRELMERRANVKQ